MSLSLPIAQVTGTQYYDTGWVMMLFTLVIVGLIAFNILRATASTKELYIRRIAGLNAIDEAIGRSTEMGKPVLMVPGLGDLNAISVQALNIFAYVTRTAARFANPIRLCCGSAAVYTVAQEIIKDVYQNEGVPERYDTDSVRFLSDRQFAFAAAVSGTILREQTAACFFMGEFFAESLIFAETANSIGAIQVASSTEITQTPFFIAACDYVLIGEEFYAASAYLNRQPVLVGSLVGQDWSKLAIIMFVLVGVLINSAQRPQNTTHMRDGNGRWVAMDPNQATSIQLGGQWLVVENVFVNVDPAWKTSAGAKVEEDGSLTVTFEPPIEVDYKSSKVPVATVSYKETARRAYIGKFVLRDGKYEKVSFAPQTEPVPGELPPAFNAIINEQEVVPVEASLRPKKRTETMFGTLGVPGGPLPMKEPRKKAEEAPK